MSEDFRNRSAVYGWWFTIAWLAMMCAFTWITLRDGPPAEQPQPAFAALLLFWLVGLATGAHAFAKPIIHVSVRGQDRVSIRRRYLSGRVEHQIRQRDTADVRVVKSTNSDGAPYFRARLRVDASVELDIWEGHDRAQAEAAVARFRQALR